MTKARLARLSVCDCGFPLLDTNIPLGTEYELDLTLRHPLSLLCGGCNKTTNGLDGVFVHERQPGQRPGYLPIVGFELVETSVPDEPSTNTDRVE